jgi:pyruvate/2-oxoglutarate/acetoin dehydrogenase E1 component
MTEAAGMYNTLLEAEEPALVIECLNGYRSKEPLPKNLGDFRIPLGIAEVVRPGTDVTVVSYGSTFHVASSASETLSSLGIEIELVDARTLLPFDLTGVCSASVAKTNRLVIVDEDVPGGASAYLLDQILHQQNAWQLLDGSPTTISAQPHLPPYGSDGDYFAKPNQEDIVEAVYALMHESDPVRYPSLNSLS